MRIKQSICYPLFKPQEMALADLVAAAAELCGHRTVDAAAGV